MGFADGGDTTSKTKTQNVQTAITPQLTGGGSDSGPIINISPFSGLTFQDKVTSQSRTGNLKSSSKKSGKTPLESALEGSGGGGVAGTSSASLDGVSGDAGSSAFDAGFSLDLSVESLTPEAAALFERAQGLTENVAGQISSLVDYSRDVLDAALSSNDANVGRALDFVSGFSTLAADSVGRGASLGAAAAQGSPVIVGSGNFDPKIGLLIVAGLVAFFYLNK